MYRTEKLLKDNADKISADDKGKLETAATTLKEALKGTDNAAIKSASEKLNEVWQAVSTELYKSAAKAPGAGQPGAEGAQPEGGEPKSEEKKTKKRLIKNMNIYKDKLNDTIITN